MSIMDIQRVSAFVKTLLGPAKKVEQEQADLPKAEDHVDISAEARETAEQVSRLAQEAKTLDVTSSERVSAAKAKLASGAYLTDEVARDTAAKAIDDLL